MQVFSHSSNVYSADLQYPRLLKEAPGHPNRIFLKGRLREVPLVAVVGTRRPTPYGKQVTQEIVTDLVRAGVGIVSGLAMGIDAVAHKTAVEQGGYTVAVLGCGIDKIYPSINRDLHHQILNSGGAIVSELPSDTAPRKHYFPARNRIIAGMSMGVLVTEADWKSGTLHTANFALDYGRDVMAVPGDIYRESSAGPHNLIRQGANLVTEASQILSVLNIEPLKDSKNSLRPASDNEGILIGLLMKGISSSHQLVEESGMDASTFAQTITLMEISGRVKNLGGGSWGLSRRS